MVDKADMEISSNLNDELKQFLNESDTDVNDIDDINFPLYSSVKQQNIKDKVIFSGGAIKGVALIGVLKAFEIKGLLNNINTYAGTSVGTVIITLHLLGYTPDEMFNIVKNFDLEKIKSISIANLLKLYGLDSGSKLEYVLERFIVAKQLSATITLKEFYVKTKKEFFLATTCLNTMKAVYLNYKTHPDLPLVKAIRMSISVPIFYTPVQHDGKLYVDGGCIDNYPIHIFKDNIDSVIGAYLVESRDHADTIDNLESCIMSIVNCLMEGVNYNSIKGYEKSTIKINVNAINIAKYGLSYDEKKQMFNAGFNQTIDFLKNHNTSVKN